uniref:Uncharacterized protein n=1 Tax=Leersia perrieri TaxID=77586 RepID=A0A0D9XAP6_9ORYZ
MQSCFKHRESDLSGISQQLHHPTTLLISCSSSLLADLPELFLRLLGQADVRLDCCIVASLDGQQHLQGARLELGEALLHGVAEIKQEGEEIISLMLCSCSSTSILPERGLDGTLADLVWNAMAGMETERLVSLGILREEIRQIAFQCG